MAILDSLFGPLTNPWTMKPDAEDPIGQAAMRGGLLYNASQFQPVPHPLMQQQPEGNPFGGLPSQAPQAPPRDMFAGQPMGGFESSPLAPAMAEGRSAMAAPMPPPRPADLSPAPNPDAPSPQAAPVSMQTPAAPATNGQQQGGGIGGFLDALGNIYGKGGPGDPLIALGLGMIGKRNIGEGLQAGFSNMQKQNLIAGQLAKQNQAQTTLAGRAAYLKQLNPNMTPEALAATAQNDTLFQDMVKRANPSEQFTQETDKDGNIWSVNKQTGQRTLSLQAQKPAQPQLTDVTMPDGSTQKQWIKPGDPAGTAVGSPVSSSSVDQGTLAKERAKNQAKQESDRAQKSVLAENVIPQIKRATQAYQKLADNGAIGPTQASGPWRTMQGVFGQENEALRQEYEVAAKELELAKAQISMKGQGAITENERRILALTLPRLDAADPKVGLNTLKMWEKQHSRFLGGNAGSPSSSDPLGIR